MGSHLHLPVLWACCRHHLDCIGLNHSILFLKLMSASTEDLRNKSHQIYVSSFKEGRKGWRFQNKTLIPAPNLKGILKVYYHKQRCRNHPRTKFNCCCCFSSSIGWPLTCFSWGWPLNFWSPCPSKCLNIEITRLFHYLGFIWRYGLSSELLQACQASILLAELHPQL